MKLLTLFTTAFFLLKSSLFAEEVMKFSTLRAAFTQTVTDKSTHTYTGSLLIQKPFKIVWKYHKPTPREIYIDKGEMITYDPRLKQATMTPLSGSMNLLKILKMGQKVKEGLYRASYDKKDIFIATQEGIIESIRYTDPLGGNVTITFDRVEKECALSDEMMTFAPPKGTTIIQGGGI